MKYFLAVLVFSYLVLAQSASAGWGSDGSTYLTVDFIEAANGATTIYFVEAVYNPASCSLNSKTVSWEDSDIGASKFFSIALAAKASGKKVRVLVDRTTCLWGGWKRLNQIQLR